MWSQLLPAFRLALALTLLTGLAYPLFVTAFSQALFAPQANGSLQFRQGQIVGSALLSQSFSQPHYFHPRPSAAGAQGYDASLSGGSNLGPTSEKLITRVKGAVAALRAANPQHQGPIPADLATTSASGLDPHLSPAAAQLQVPRVAAARSVSPAEVQAMVAQATQGRDLGLFGEPRVNVLLLNLALDRVHPLPIPQRSELPARLSAPPVAPAVPAQ